MELRKKYPEPRRRLLQHQLRPDQGRQLLRDIVRELESARLGAQGVKIWKDLGMTSARADGKLLKGDDPRLDPFWAKCGELGMPVLIHMADPKEYWYPLTYNSFHYGMRSEKEQHYDRDKMPRLGRADPPARQHSQEAPEDEVHRRSTWAA